MKKRTLSLLAIALCIGLFLTGCWGNDEEDASLEAETELQEEVLDTELEGEDDAQTSEVAPLNLMSTQDYDISIPEIPTVSYSDVLDSKEAGLDALVNGEGDLLLMSVLDAARSYGDYDIQILAIVGDEGDNLFCLMVRSGAFADSPDAYLALLSDYEAALDSTVLFAADWDMMDMVQAHLETLFETMDSPDFYIPDSKFYAFLVS